MHEAMRMVLRLGLICLIAALVLGGVYAITKDPIEQQRLAANNEARRIIMKDASDFKLLDLEAFEGDADVLEVAQALSGGDVIGYTFSVMTTGYGGDMQLMVGISSDGNVTGVHVGTNAETAGVGSKVTEDDFKGQFAGKSAAQALEVGSDINAITGATVSSRAVTKGVNAAIAYYNQFLKGGAQ
nr:RnfABCDGE type electron transport complex subunit G [Maliibacterium massiliense]